MGQIRAHVLGTQRPDPARSYHVSHAVRLRFPTVEIPTVETSHSSAHCRNHDYYRDLSTIAGTRSLAPESYWPRLGRDAKASSNPGIRNSKAAFIDPASVTSAGLLASRMRLEFADSYRMSTLWPGENDACASIL